MLRPSFKSTLAAVAVLAAVGLSGCSSLDDPQETTASVSGVVSKGIIVGGKVYAYPIINGVVVKDVPLGETTTNPAGKYTINVLSYTGPLAIVVGPASDGSSRVKCDVPDGCAENGNSYNFGQLMPFDYSLEALVPNVTGGSSISVSVTPLTNMAAAYAKSLGLTASGDTVRLANEKVAKLLDLENILTTEPVDVTDSALLSSTSTSAASIKYGYIAASIASIANDDASGNVGKAIASLSQSYVDNNGELIGKESVDNADIVSLLEITNGALTIMQAEKGASGGVFDLVKNEVEAAQGAAAKGVVDDSTETTTETVVAVGNVESAKAIVTELRTWGAALRTDLMGNEGGMSGDAGAVSRVGMAVETAGPDFEQVVMSMAKGVFAMVTAYNQRQDGTIDDGTYPINNFVNATDLADFFDEDHSESSEAVYDESMPDESETDSMMSSKADVSSMLMEPMGNAFTGDVIVSGNVIELSGVKINGIDVSLKMTAPESTSGSEFTVTLAQSSASNDNVEFVFNESFATVSFVDNVENILLLDEEADKPKKLVLSLSGKLAHKESSTAEIKINFEGSIEAEVFVTYSTWEDGEEVQDINPGLVVFDGAFSVSEADVKDEFAAKLEVNMANAETFTGTEPKYLGGMNYPDFARYEFSSDGNKLTISWPDGDEVYTYSEDSKEVTKVSYSNDGSLRYTETVNFYDFSAFTYVSEFDSLDAFVGIDPELSGLGWWYRDIELESSYLNVLVDTPSEWLKTGGDIGVFVEYAYNDDILPGENADNWRDLDGKLTVAANFDGLPEASVVASVNRYGYQAATGSLTLKYDDVTIVASGDLDASNEKNIKGSISIIVKTAEGELTIYPDVATGELEGSVKVNGEVVGSIISTDDGVLVRYLDGSFETVLF